MDSSKTIKETSVEYRPYERCYAYGPEVLTDQELLAIIMRTGSLGESSVALADKVLSYGDNKQGLLTLLHLSVEELMCIKGIGKVKAIQLKCIGELSKRISRKTAGNKLDFSSPASIAGYYMEELRHEEKEQLVLVMMNTKHRLIRDKIMTTGTVSCSLVSTREIFIEALKSGAVYIVLIHNHPSGDPSPSREDIINTKHIKEAGSLIGIELVDHIIIGDSRYLSMREKSIL